MSAAHFFPSRVKARSTLGQIFSPSASVMATI
jgi:hypothetical protein